MKDALARCVQYSSVQYSTVVVVMVVYIDLKNCLTIQGISFSRTLSSVNYWKTWGGDIAITFKLFRRKKILLHASIVLWKIGILDTFVLVYVYAWVVMGEKCIRYYVVLHQCKSDNI